MYMKPALKISIPVSAVIAACIASFAPTASAQIMSTFTIVPAIVSVASTTCPLHIGFLKEGAANKASDVAKLQAFLKDVEGMDVSVTGIFDHQTEQAVEAFQRKYMDDVMKPWGATRPSGVVYITTSKMIDQVYCGTPLSLNGPELSAIDSWNQAQAAADAQAASGTLEDASPSGSHLTPDGLAGPLVIPTSDQAAAAAGPSMSGRLWSFIKGLFGR